MDHHVPAAVSEGLRQRGVDVLTAHEDRSAEVDDDLLLQRATELNRALYTQDDDFLVIAGQWLEMARPFAGLIFARQLGVTIGQAIEDLELIAKASQDDDLRKRVYFLPLR